MKWCHLLTLPDVASLHCPPNSMRRWCHGVCEVITGSPNRDPLRWTISGRRRWGADLIELLATRLVQLAAKVSRLPSAHSRWIPDLFRGLARANDV